MAGTATDKLYGVAEGLWEPDLVSMPCVVSRGVEDDARLTDPGTPRPRPRQEPEDLFETISQTLLAAVDRDCISGWGAVVHVM